jgi:hypothetical protein
MDSPPLIATAGIINHKGRGLFFAGEWIPGAPVVLSSSRGTGYGQTDYSQVFPEFSGCGDDYADIEEECFSGEKQT